MERIRVSKAGTRPAHKGMDTDFRPRKVEDVTMWRRGTRSEGNLHLMPHHVVFRYLAPPPPGSSPSTKPKPKETWITYPMISRCVLRPSPPASHQSPSIRLQCRDFTFFSFLFVNDKKARDVYDSIRGLSCKVGHLDKLLAFAYQPKPPEDQHNGWELYDARREWKRLGISPKDSEKGWRISEINKDYKVWLTCVMHLLMLTVSIVFENVPCPARRPVQDLRQCTQLRRTISLASENTRPRLPPSHQQLLNNAQLAAAARDTWQSQSAGRAPGCSYMGYQQWVEDITIPYTQPCWLKPGIERCQRQ
jgi:hypothetical protein